MIWMLINVHIEDLMDYVNQIQHQLNVKSKIVLMLQCQLLQMMNVKPIKMVVFQMVKDALRQQVNPYVHHILVIIQLVLDILDQMEFVKEMQQVLNAELENVKMDCLQLMIYVGIIKHLVLQMENNVLQQKEHAVHLKEQQHLVLYILVQMDIVREQVQQLKQLVHQKFVMKHQQLTLQMMPVINFK